MTVLKYPCIYHHSINFELDCGYCGNIQKSFVKEINVRPVQPEIDGECMHMIIIILRPFAVILDVVGRTPDDRCYNARSANCQHFVLAFLVAAGIHVPRPNRSTIQASKPGFMGAVKNLGQKCVVLYNFDLLASKSGFGWWFGRGTGECAKIHRTRRGGVASRHKGNFFTRSCYMFLKAVDSSSVRGKHDLKSFMFSHADMNHSQELLLDSVVIGSRADSDVQRHFTT
jgi:hypothetical protein